METNTAGKQNILILIAYYLPGYKIGGPLTSILNIVNNLSHEFNFKILTSDRDVYDSKPYAANFTNKWVVIGKSSIYYVRRNFFVVFSLIKQIKKLEKDIIYINSLFDPIFSIAVAIAVRFKIIKIRTVILSPKGELFEEALRLNNFKKKIYLWLALKLNIYKNVIWHASTEYEKKCIVKVMGIDPGLVRIAMNLSEIPENHAGGVVKNTEKTELNEEGYLRIVFLGRIAKDKNIGYTFEILSQLNENIVFDIYGPIEDKNLWELCQQKIEKLPKNIKVNYRGSLSRDDVQKTLGSYDLFFFPSFAENYGHVIAESLTVGTPVLISDNTPWRELQKDRLGWDLCLDNPELFVKAIREMASCPKSQLAENRIHISATALKLLSDPEIIDANKNLFQHYNFQKV